MSSEYEQNVGKLIAEKTEKYESMKNDPNVTKSELESLLSEIESLEALYENYNLGMSYFRRARGGRAGLRE
jgi:colicin import membrane protein